MASRLLQDLLDRRVPQYAAVYLGASWALVEFMAFLEDRYLFSPHLTNFVLLTLALLLPSVLLFSYCHGRPGADRWVRAEKIGIPVNILMTLLVLYVVFGGKELGAVTTTVSTEDEDGNRIERVVPKAEFRKRIALFPPDVGADQRWLGEAVVYGLMSDLYQDMFLDLRVPQHYLPQLNETGFSTAYDVPRGLKRQVAQELHVGYFVEGTVTRADDRFRLVLALHDAEGGDVVAEHTFEDANLFALIDSASLQLRRDLALPAAHLEQNPDRSLAEMTTESLEAYRHYSEAVASIVYETDYQGARTELERAVEVDPTFADAHFMLYATQIYLGDPGSARVSLQNAMAHLYRMPERMQFTVKAEHYALEQELPKMFAVHEMRAELYPQDVDAHLIVAEIRRMQDDLPGVVAALEKALELDPTRVELLRTIGEHYRSLGRFDRAREYLQRYADRFPERSASAQALGELALVMGRHDEAREHLERARLLEPTEVAPFLSLARLEQVLGRWSHAEENLEAALAAARTPTDRERAYTAYRRYHAYRGDYDTALAYQLRALDEASRFQPPLAMVQMELMGLGDYVRAGRVEDARRKLDSLSARLAPPTDALVPLGRIQVWAAMEEPAELEAAILAAEEMLERSSFDMLASAVSYGRGQLHEMRREWPLALQAYHAEQERAPTDPTIPGQLGRVHAQMGDFERAEELLQRTLSIWPSHPRTNYELGLLYRKMRRPGDAVSHLDRALDAWSIADPGHERAVLAREALAEAQRQLRVERPRG